MVRSSRASMARRRCFRPRRSDRESLPQRPSALFFIDLFLRKLGSRIEDICWEPLLDESRFADAKGSGDEGYLLMETIYG
ncbi:MAG: hypothetical protein D6741_17505 [Planctomycetota bacterium]|nr:MAG: hypothetical protein D6741_17505 [Planctomycetota bacterium]